MSKVILVTGASRGVGHAIATFLIKAPPKHKLVLTSRTVQPLQKLQELAPDRVQYTAGDLSDPKCIKEAIDLAVSKFGRLDGMILNHGTLGQVKKIADLEAEDWEDAYRTNMFSCALAAKYAIPELRKTKGRIIITSSGAALKAYTGWGIYGSTKAAVNHLTLTLKTEEPEITTIAIRPGVVDTEMQREIREKHKDVMDEEDVKKFSSAFTDGKLVKPEQCGHVIAKLAVQGPSELSGQFLSWDDEKLSNFQWKG